jgi:peptidylprolyl isomerase
VRVHYAAALSGGATFRESRATGAPIEHVVGDSRAFCGFDRALVGMRAGGKRRVIVPAALAFGESGRAPDVPPNADLVLTLEVFWPQTAPIDKRAPPTRGGAPVRGGGGAGGRRR